MNRVVVLVLLLWGAPALAQKPEAVALKRQADAYLTEGAPGKAVAAYRQAIALDPQYLEAHEALAAHYLRLQEYGTAITVLRQALARSASYPQGWYNLAYALRKQGKLDAAIGAYRRFARLRPTSPDPYYGIGLALQDKGDIKGAAHSFRRYAELEQNPAKKAWKERALALAIKLEQQAGVPAPPSQPAKPAKPAKPTGPASPNVVTDPPPTAKAPTKDDTLPPSSSHEEDRSPVTPQRERAMVFKAHGDALVRQGQLAPAANSYRQAIRVDFSYTAAFNELGTVLFGLKRYEDAIQTFRIAIRDNPDYHLGWYNLAYALRKAGRLLPAIAAYNKFIEAKPSDPDAYFGLALAYRTAGNGVEAAKAFKKYIALEQRQSQEQWVHRAKVELAKLEGRAPPEYVPGQVIVPPTPPAAPKVLSLAEQKRLARLEKKQKLELARQRKAEERKLKAEQRKLAQQEHGRKLALERERKAEARKRVAEERKLKAEARKLKAQQLRLAQQEQRKRKAEERKLARLARGAGLSPGGLSPGPSGGEPRSGAEPGAQDVTARAQGKIPSAVPAPTPVAVPAPTPAAPSAPMADTDLSGIDPTPDVILSPPMPSAPGAPGDSESDRLRVQGDTLARGGKLQQAARLYIQAVKVDPFNTRAYDGLAYAAFKLGGYLQGARHLSNGLRDNPTYTDGWLYQARLFRAAADRVKAVGSYRKYLADRPTAVAVQLELARTLKSLNMTDQAILAYRACLGFQTSRGNEPVVVAARAELRGLGVEPSAVAAITQRPSPTNTTRSVVVAPVPTIPVPTIPGPTLPGGPTPAAVTPTTPTKSPARLKAEARRAAREAEKLARVERTRAAREKREKAAAERKARLEAQRESRKAQIEAARLARQEQQRAQREKRATAAQERKRKQLAARQARRQGGRQARGTEVAQMVAQDMDEAMPPVPPRTRMHDVLQPAPDAAAGLMKVADEQFAQKRYVVALGIYQQAARLDPGSSEPLYRAGVAAVALGQMHLAADLFTQVLKIDPANGTARVNLQMAQAAGNANRPSASYLKEALAQAQTMLDQGRYALAEQQCTRLLAHSVSPQLHLIRAEARLAQRKPQQALADGGRVLALDPGVSQAFRVMGDAQRQLGHRERAVYYFRLYLSRLSDDDAAKMERGQIEQVISELSRGE